MKLYFLRHGKATWPNWDKPDDERPLTQKGKKQMRRVAQSLANFKVSPSVILSSPLPRAYQTAAIVAEALGLAVTEEPALAPGFNGDRLAELLRKYAGPDVMVVGHEPDFSNTIATLTGGEVLMAKAGLARVDMDDTNPTRGELVWLVPPKFLR